MGLEAGGRLADGEPNMALLGEPMERLGSNAKGFRAIVIKDEDFKPIDASALQANPVVSSTAVHNNS
jgi:hypothetical protein